MPYCVPIKDLKDTSSFSKMVKEADHPIFVTKNGREEFVVMSTKIYEDKKTDSAKQKFYAYLKQSEDDIANGRYEDAFKFLEQLEQKYGN